MPHQATGIRPDWNPRTAEQLNAREIARHSAQIAEEINRIENAARELSAALDYPHPGEWTPDQRRALASLRAAIANADGTPEPAPDPIGWNCPQCHGWTPGEKSSPLCKACQLETLGQPPE